MASQVVARGTSWRSPPHSSKIPEHISDLDRTDTIDFTKPGASTLLTSIAIYSIMTTVFVFLIVKNDLQ